MRVGNRGLSTTGSVTHGPRIGSRRLRADLQRSFGADPRDGSAASTDRDHVDHRDLARIGAHSAFGGQRWPAVDDDRDISRGSTAVTGDDGVEAGCLGDDGRPQRASRRARQHGRDRLMDHLLSREDAAVRLHHVERDAARLIPFAAGVGVETPRDVIDVPLDIWLHGRINQRGDGSLVLAVFAQHVG
jgi:hypothetical protein